MRKAVAYLEPYDTWERKDRRRTQGHSARGKFLIADGSKGRRFHASQEHRRPCGVAVQTTTRVHRHGVMSSAEKIARRSGQQNVRTMMVSGLNHAESRRDGSTYARRDGNGPGWDELCVVGRRRDDECKTHRCANRRGNPRLPSCNVLDAKAASVGVLRNYYT